ncbi:MAG: hypothetical protein LBC53_08790 [Spirochaetaceae bacterium]|jgi:hypothetical protein|nr:hypothetical protein [Spirochaetaceae bacterium]
MNPIDIGVVRQPCWLPPKSLQNAWYFAFSSGSCSEVAEDYTSLDGSVRKQVNEKIDKLKENPFF